MKENLIRVEKRSLGFLIDLIIFISINPNRKRNRKRNIKANGIFLILMLCIGSKYNNKERIIEEIADVTKRNLRGEYFLIVLSKIAFPKVPLIAKNPAMITISIRIKRK